MTIYHHGFMNETKEITEYEHAIFGKCHGILLMRRGENDPHVCIHPIVEDDETWHTPPSGGFSSFWLSDYIEVIKQAREWIQMNCEIDPSGFGWLFKDEHRS
jgi:hypothetical protein